MAWEAVITESGLGMLEQISAGGSILNLSKVVTGKGTVSSASLASQTTVSSPEDDSTGVISREIESDGVRIEVRVFAYEEAYTLKQIGVFGKVDDGPETLFALMQNTDGIDILASSTFPDFAFNVAMFVESSHAASFTATVNPNALVSQAELAEALANVQSLKREYYAAATSVNCPFTNNSKTYLVWSAGSGEEIVDSDGFGSLFIVSNGKYCQIKKGANITVSTANNKFTINSTSAVAMAVVEL